jgi:hypothetical protein
VEVFLFQERESHRTEARLHDHLQSMRRQRPGTRKRRRPTSSSSARRKCYRGLWMSCSEGWGKNRKKRKSWLADAPAWSGQLDCAHICASCSSAASSRRPCAPGRYETFRHFISP